MKPSQVAMSLSKNNMMGNVPITMSGRNQANANKMSSNNYNGVQSFKSGSDASFITNFKVASQNAFTRPSSGFFGALKSPFSVLNKSKNQRCQPVKAMASDSSEPEFTIKSNVKESVEMEMLMRVT